MPIVPGLNEQTVKAAAANTPYFTVKATAEDFGSEIGKSMGSLGKSLGEVSDTALKFADQGQQQQQEADVSDAVNVATQFNANLQKIEESFYSLQGEPAATGETALAMQLNHLKRDALSTAKTPESAKLALGAIDGSLALSMGRMGRHAQAQQSVYDDELDHSRYAQSRQEISRNYNDDQTFRIIAHIADQSAQHIAIRGARAAGGANGPEQIMAAAAATQPSTASDLARARLEGALAQGDLPIAQKLMAQHGYELLPADKAAVEQQFEAVQYQHQSQQETQRIMAISRPMPGDAPAPGR